LNGPSELADDAGTVIAIDAFSFGAFAMEYLTAPALQIQQRIQFETGTYGDFDVWEPLLRLLYTGRPLYEPSAINRTNLDRVFHWGTDSLAEIGSFYNEHGFAVVRGVFSANEAASFDVEIDRLAAEATADDGDSWWVTSEGGEEHVCQLHYTSLASPLIDQLEHDARIKATR